MISWRLKGEKKLRVMEVALKLQAKKKKSGQDKALAVLVKLKKFNLSSYVR